MVPTENRESVGFCNLTQQKLFAILLHELIYISTEGATSKMCLSEYEFSTSQITRDERVFD